MIEIKQTATYMTWESKLKDQRAKAAIAARIFRLANGLPGDVSPVGQGVSELRIHYGQGIGFISSSAGMKSSSCYVVETRAVRQKTLRLQNAWRMSGGHNERANL